MGEWHRLVGRASPGARTVERDGVLATVVPAAPERSVFNSVMYDSAARLAAAYDEVAAAYADVGAAWTVWVPSGDEEARTLLAGAGHKLDGEPQAMAIDLTRGVERPPAGALEDWTAEGDPADVGPLNDRAYDHGTDSFTRAMRGLERDPAAVYIARRDGRPAGCLIVLDHGRNATIELVAVAPEARRRARHREQHPGGHEAGQLGLRAARLPAGRRRSDVGAQMSSTCSSNMTSPSSARCTGHLAPICMSRSRCSSGSSLGNCTFISKRVGDPRWAGSYDTSTAMSPTSQPLRAAYISMVIAVHEARLAASSS
jgi:hypothetical protein